MKEGVIRILCLEDRKADYELCRQYIIRKSPDVIFSRASNKEEFLDKINRGTYDLVLGDYNIPGYNGLSALLYVKEHYPDLPFVFLTGTLKSEEESAGAILKGANGYVLKDNIRTLPDYISKVLETAKQDAERREAHRRALRAQNLRLQKAAGMLRNASDLSKRDEIVELIEQSLNTL